MEPPARSGVTPFGWSLLIALVVLAATRSRAQDPSLGGAVLVAVLVVLVIGGVWPLVARRVTNADSMFIVDDPAWGRGITPDRAASDTVVGSTCSARLALRSGVLRSAVSVRCVGAFESPWQTVASHRPLDLTVTAGRRGVFDHVTIDVRCMFPLGVSSFAKRVDLPLVRPLFVAPSVDRTVSLPEPGADQRSDGAAPGARVGGDLARSLRPYRIGDPPHRVHWPTSARAGELMVREFEVPPVPTVLIVVDLRSPAASDASSLDVGIELAVSRAAGLAEAALAGGGRVVLATCDASGPTIGDVRSAQEIGRRLAAAVPGAPGQVQEASASSWSLTLVAP